MNQKKVRGIGIYEKGRFKSSVMQPDGSKVITREYMYWRHMLERCEVGGVQQRNKPAYVGCTVHPEFIHFQDFAVWCQDQIGYGVEGYELDKDILVPGNKVYGPQTCCFVPKVINSLLITNPRGMYGIGVSKDPKRDRYKAQVSVNSRQKNLGWHPTAEQAEAAYTLAKKKLVADAADLWKDRIDPRVYAALLVWEPGRKILQ